MPTTYHPADNETCELLRGLIDEHRRDLAAIAGLRILLLFAFGDNGKPPMRSRGSRVLGTCQTHSYLDRVKGAPDATITLDGDWWTDASPTRRKALLHHELLHIAPYLDGKEDDLGRPVLRTCPGDWEFDGFHELVEIYGSDAAEYRNLAAIAEKHRQLKLPWSLPADDDGERTALKAEINEAFRVAAATEVPEGQPAATTGHTHGAMANRTVGRGGETI